MIRVLVTGATGFVGQVLCESLARAGYLVRAALRTDAAPQRGVAERAIVGDIGAATDWQSALQGIELVVHVAARAHHVAEVGARPELFTETNATGTGRLAAAAAAAGVRRLIYLSTVKVNGEGSDEGPYRGQDQPHPQGVYANSKWLGEKLLQQVAADTHLQVVIVRSPLVYGSGVRANFLRLLDWVDRGWPIPLASVSNRRSLVSVWNLCDLLTRLLEHPAAPAQVWMVSDGVDHSTPEVIREIGRAMRRPVKLIPAPVALLRLVGALTGRADDVAKLCDSLQVDIAQTCRQLSWSPPLTFPDSVARTVAWYLSRGRQA
jgi:nucleoside-diphosphate-sugar epimerase